MRIFEIVESIKNTYKILDVLIENNTLAREIRQTYNKVRKKKNFTIDQKRVIKMWTEWALTQEKVTKNPQLVQMIEFILSVVK